MLKRHARLATNSNWNIVHISFGNCGNFSNRNDNKSSVENINNIKPNDSRDNLCAWYSYIQSVINSNEHNISNDQLRGPNSNT